MGSGKWKFYFKYAIKERLDLQRYQSVLHSIRDEFEPKFQQMSIADGEVNWTTSIANENHANTVHPPYVNNVFAEFSYNCTRTHSIQGPGHGTWTLMWNPKLNKNQNKLHARCAPDVFKEFSNEIQQRLCAEFPEHFKLNWENGISGYESDIYDILSDITTDPWIDGYGYPVIQGFDLSSDRCPHWYPWGYCPSECYLALIPYGLWGV